MLEPSTVYPPRETSGSPNEDRKIKLVTLTPTKPSVSSLSGQPYQEKPMTEFPTILQQHQARRKQILKSVFDKNQNLGIGDSQTNNTPGQNTGTQITLPTFPSATASQSVDE